MIRSLPSLKVIVLFICLYYKLVSFRGLYKLRPRPDWSLLGVKFKISDEHPRPIYMGVPPPGSAFVGATMAWGKVGLPFFKMIACAFVKSNKCQHSSDVQTKALHAL